MASGRQSARADTVSSGNLLCGGRGSAGKQNKTSIHAGLTGDFPKKVWREGERDQLRK